MHIVHYSGNYSHSLPLSLLSSSQNELMFQEILLVSESDGGRIRACVHTVAAVSVHCIVRAWLDASSHFAISFSSLFLTSSDVVGWLSHFGTFWSGRDHSSEIRGLYFSVVVPLQFSGDSRVFLPSRYI